MQTNVAVGAEQAVTDARHAVTAEAQPWVFEVEEREGWVCTATGVEGTGPVAVVRPRVEPSHAGDYSGEALLSLDALRMAVEVLEDRLGDDLGN